MIYSKIHKFYSIKSPNDGDAKAPTANPEPPVPPTLLTG